MTIWIPIAAITLVVVVVLLLPLFGRIGGAATRLQRELAIYRDQLAEVERERLAERISAAEAVAAANEIQRKMLASASTSDRAEQTTDPQAATHSRLVAVVAVGSLAPLGALLVYLTVGSPTVPGYPFDATRRSQADASKPSNAEIESMIATLAERMKQDPSNLEGWTLLARSYVAMGHYAEAVKAYERVYALSKNDVAYAGDYGEALVLAADGQVVPQARSLFEQVKSHDPSDPRARYFLGLALEQSGKPRDAVALWRSLEADSPPDAAWLSTLREGIKRAAADAGVDPASIPSAPSAPIASQSGPTADDVNAAQSMSAEERRQMIEGMVARLAARLESEPNDVEGWLRLARSYAVLDQKDQAARALRRAAAVADAPPALKEQVQSAARELGIDLSAEPGLPSPPSN